MKNNVLEKNDEVVISSCPCCGIDVYVPIMNGFVVNPYIFGDDDFDMPEKDAFVTMFNVTDDGTFNYVCPKCLALSSCKIKKGSDGSYITKRVNSSVNDSFGQQENANCQPGM